MKTKQSTVVITPEEEEVKAKLAELNGLCAELEARYEHAKENAKEIKDYSEELERVKKSLDTANIKLGVLKFGIAETSELVRVKELEVKKLEDKEKSLKDSVELLTEEHKGFMYANEEMHHSTEAILKAHDEIQDEMDKDEQELKRLKVEIESETNNLKGIISEADKARKDLEQIKKDMEDSLTRMSELGREQGEIVEKNKEMLREMESLNDLMEAKKKEIKEFEESEMARINAELATREGEVSIKEGWLKTKEDKLRGNIARFEEYSNKKSNIVV